MTIVAFFISLNSFIYIFKKLLLGIIS